jgi:hypothetical protein
MNTNFDELLIQASRKQAVKLLQNTSQHPPRGSAQNDAWHKTTRLAKFDGEGVFNVPQRDQLLLIVIFPLQSISLFFSTHWHVAEISVSRHVCR